MLKQLSTDAHPRAHRLSEEQRAPNRLARPGRTGTFDPEIRSLVLYPTELRAPERHRTANEGTSLPEVRTSQNAAPLMHPRNERSTSVDPFPAENRSVNRGALH